MRSKILLAIMELLPEGEEINKVKIKLTENATKTKNLILKAKKWGRYIVEIYLIISYLLQTFGVF